MIPDWIGNFTALQVGGGQWIIPWSSEASAEKCVEMIKQAYPDIELEIVRYMASWAVREKN